MRTILKVLAVFILAALLGLVLALINNELQQN